MRECPQLSRKNGVAVRSNAYYLKAVSLNEDKMSQLKNMQDKDLPIWLPSLHIGAAPPLHWPMNA